MAKPRLLGPVRLFRRVPRVVQLGETGVGELVIGHAANLTT
jgi:hypothetical protein